MAEVVQGFIFDSGGDEMSERNNTICKIISRATAATESLLQNGPAFIVEFGDGERAVVYGTELSPWFPTD